MGGRFLIILSDVEYLHRLLISPLREEYLGTKLECERVICSVGSGKPENMIICRSVIGLNMSKKLSNKDCFVALFDILGFSELVRKNELGRVANTYSRAKKVFKERLSYINALNKGFKMDVMEKYRNFSDTFLIYTSTKDEGAFLSLLAACDGLFIGAIENRLLIKEELLHVVN